MLQAFNDALALINSIIWHQYVIIVLLIVGGLFTVWNRLSQFRSLTHGFGVVLGRHSSKDEPGAITHFQALSAALSATVGVGNIGGTALAIAIGGPGALFWMWIVGLLGMALKTMEVTLSMLYRSTAEDGSVKGGPMWVVVNAMKSPDGKVPFIATVIASLFCVTLLIATFTGGLFFQAWNASNVTSQFFGVPEALVGAILAVVVGLVILGGITRIGTVASKIVPFMCGVYLIAGVYVIAINAGDVPAMLGMVLQSAFSGSDASGAFVGGTLGSVFAIGMQQAFFSNESGQGSSPIVHSAAKTKEPVREGVVAGLEPFIDTIVVCTMTGLVILLSGVWNRDADFRLKTQPQILETENSWEIADTPLPTRDDHDWNEGDQVFCIVELTSGSTTRRAQVTGEVVSSDGKQVIEWSEFESDSPPVFCEDGVFQTYAGASLTALAFDRAHPGLGSWLVTLATWLFGISTMISWSYYGEQSVVFLFGQRAVKPYKILFCVGIVLSCLGLVRSQTELTHLANLGTGVMLWVNIPITLLFAGQAVKAHRDYWQRMSQTGRKESQK